MKEAVRCRRRREGGRLAGDSEWALRLPSLLAGFMGALASQFWFLALALATAASVRTLALVEVLFAQGISRFVFKQATTTREVVGIVLIVIGVVVLLWAH